MDHCPTLIPVSRPYLSLELETKCSFSAACSAGCFYLEGNWCVSVLAECEAGSLYSSSHGLRRTQMRCAF